MNRRTFLKTTTATLLAGVLGTIIVKPTTTDKVEKLIVAKPTTPDKFEKLIVDIEKFIEQVGNRYVSKPNTQETRNDLSKVINDYLEELKYRNEIYRYHLMCDELNNTPETVNNMIIGRLFIQPRKIVEYIVFDFKIVISA